MRPYRSGNYVVGNQFLMDLSNGRITFHCRRTMQLLASKFPPDQPEITAPAEPSTPLAVPTWYTDEERLAVYLPVITAALARPAPLAGCRRSQEDAFWGTSLAARTAAGNIAAAEPARSDDISTRAAVIVAQAVLANAIRQEVTPTVEEYPTQAPARPAQRWTDSDEELYHLANTWECAVYHWSEG